MLNEEEIQAAEVLRAKGEFASALALTQDMLSRVEDEDTRMRLLFDVLYCSTELCLDAVTNAAIAELAQMPQPRMSRIFVDFIQAMSDIAHGHFQRGLDLLEANLKSEFMEQDDFQFWKYKHLAYKGSALTGLGRCPEALEALAEAHRMKPGGERETAILIDQANCLQALGRYYESYEAASQVQARGDDEMATWGMQYMAESRMWQGMVPEALKIYMQVQKRLPCRLVEEDRIQLGIERAISYLEKRTSQEKLF
jgi:tetratricopeptide (TPR) repeat protein